MKSTRSYIDLTITAASIASKGEIQFERQTNTHLCDSYKNTAKNKMHYLEISINWLKAPDLHVLAQCYKLCKYELEWRGNRHVLSHELSVTKGRTSKTIVTTYRDTLNQNMAQFNLELCFRVVVLAVFLTVASSERYIISNLLERFIVILNATVSRNGGIYLLV